MFRILCNGMKTLILSAEFITSLFLYECEVITKALAESPFYGGQT